MSEPLRKCTQCGLEATRVDDLEQFVKCKGRPYERRNRCKKCQMQDYYNNADAIRKKARERYQRDGAQIRLKNKIWYDKNKEEINRCRREKYANSPFEHKLTNKIEVQRVRLKTLEHIKYPAVCERCGESNFLVLTIDHINNDGQEERKKHSTIQTWRRILKMKKNDARKRYQVLCRNCNWLKRIERIYEKP